jgi:hypothetical protein
MLLYGRLALLQSYLIAYVFWLGIALGCQGLLLLHHLVGGRWGAPIRPLLQAGMATLPLLLLLFLPLAIGAHDLYAWARPGAGMVGNKRLYLSVPFFLVRAALCFAVWLGLGAQLRRAARRGDGERLARLAGPGLVLHVLTVTFALWDWTATLDPRWHSTIYGLLIIAGQALAALSFAVLVLTVRTAPSSQADALQDLGSLTLTFVMLWAYLSFMQLLIMWSGNLPHEARFYIPRLHGPFGKLGAGLLVAYFALPVLLLLHRGLKRSGRVLDALAVVLLVGGWAADLWLVAPDFHRPRLLYGTDVATTLAVGCLFLGVFLRGLAAGERKGHD